MNIIYLASPYGHPEPGMRHIRFLAACHVAGKLLQRGINVYSPIAHSHPIAVAFEPPLELDWVALDLEILRHCKEVWVLAIPGWRESKGVSVETSEAVKLGIPIRYVDALGFVIDWHLEVPIDDGTLDKLESVREGIVAN